MQIAEHFMNDEIKNLKDQIHLGFQMQFLGMISLNLIIGRPI